MKKLVFSLFRFYQVIISPLFKYLTGSIAVCRYTPTCSAYFTQAVFKYGVIQGTWLGLKRLVHCHPGGKGGFDPVPSLLQGTN